MRKPGREHTVELWRFFFCIAVLGFHFFSKIDSKIFRAGYLGVEFFFVLSGYGIYSFYTQKMKGGRFAERLAQFGYYIGARLIRLYPLYLISLFCMLLVKIIQNHWSVWDVVHYVKSGWAEFLMLQCGPLGNEVLISANWYVASLFWGSVLLLGLLMLTGKVGGYILCPMISFLIYQYYFELIRKIDVIFSYHAVLRAIAGLSLGIFVGFLSNYIYHKWNSQIEGEEKGKKHKSMLVLYIFANLILSCVFIYTNFGRRSGIDFVVIALYAVAVLMLFVSRIPMDEKKKVLFARLSSWTYPIYLFQMPVIECILWLIRK